MHNTIRILWITVICLGLTTSSTVHAQSLFVGPTAWYLISTNAPGSSNGAGQPTRYMVGAAATIPFNKKTELRTTVGYRSESGSFTTPLNQLPTTDQRVHPPVSLIQVVDNPNATPQLPSTLTASSLELTASLCFPVMPLDSSGAALGFSLGGLVDYMMSAQQDDDYSAIDKHQGPAHVIADYESQLGFGALLGLYIALPVGTNRLNFDLQYVFRNPTTITSATTPPVEQSSGWLIGKGLRVGLSFGFGL